MRDIKFRVWKWKTGYMTPVITMSWTMTTYVPKIKYINLKRKGDYELMQFTGLLDRHGKEIYEGDLLKTRERDAIHRHLVYEVVWVGVGFQLKPNDRGYESQVVTSGVDLEIIGNIWENPELLK